MAGAVPARLTWGNAEKMNMLRAHDALAVIHFAPIRRAADEHCGIEDPQPLRYQNNEFAYRWRSDEDFDFAAIRGDLEARWDAFARHLCERYDGVAAIQAELTFELHRPVGRLSAVPGLDQAARAGADFLVSMRSAVPPLGTLSLAVKPGRDAETALLRASLLGHPGSPTVANLMQWFDRAHAAIEAKVGALVSNPAEAPSE